ncbi:hypothetical protein GWD52_07395 [Enterobacteriaceae bacterium 4M9]|nr:hypothetical protein [Enterobacteriaceae bacterium 4M9]
MHIIIATESYLMWLCILFVSLWGGIVRELMKRNRLKTPRWASLGRQIIVSVFAGTLGALLGFELGFSDYMKVLMAGFFSLTDIQSARKMFDIIMFRKTGIK